MNKTRHNAEQALLLLDAGTAGPKTQILKSVTHFQMKVYRATLSIPKGQVRSYKWVAKKTGSPRAYRAVGNALNKNPYPGIIPCHRVVKSDGTIGGFSKGLRAKKQLLRSEGIKC